LNELDANDDSETNSSLFVGIKDLSKKNLGDAELITVNISVDKSANNDFKYHYALDGGACDNKHMGMCMEYKAGEIDVFKAWWKENPGEDPTYGDGQKKFIESVTTVRPAELVSDENFQHGIVTMPKLELPDVKVRAPHNGKQMHGMFPNSEGGAYNRLHAYSSDTEEGHLKPAVYQLCGHC
jgi:hypothetical protein